MVIIDMTKILAENGAVLTGRSALGLRGIVSLDPRVIMEIANTKETIYVEPRMLVPDNRSETEIFDGMEIATLNQSIYDAFLYDYDDSYVEEMLDTISDDELSNFFRWLSDKSCEDIEAISDKFSFYGVEDRWIQGKK